MSLRGKVLGSYRLLLRACQNLCQDDLVALNCARATIKEEYTKHGTVENEQEIEEWVGRAVDAEKMLRHHVVQAVPVDDNLYRLRITEETVLSDNPIPPANPPH